MSEAYGFLLVKTTDPLAKELLDSEEEISQETMLKLLVNAGISLDEDDGIYSHEGITAKAGYVLINIFGDDWMFTSEFLVQHGKGDSGFEIYGRMFHEHGYLQCYALNRSTKFCKGFDFEGEDEESESSEEGLINEWLSVVPELVKRQFKDNFSTE